MQLKGTAETAQQQHMTQAIAMMVSVMTGVHSYDSEPHQQVLNNSVKHPDCPGGDSE